MRRALVIGAAIVGLTASSTLAWEKDLHYGLTLWLALQAGYSQVDALEIAKLDQSEDDGTVTPATYMEIHVLVTNSESGSRTVSEKHFPTTGKIPGKPSERTVVPGDDAACLKLNELKDYRGTNALQKFGAALHPFQDSWSHQGIPDVPLRPGMRFNEALSWSHPAKRGGWGLHHADITAAWREDTLETAHGTYSAMLAFRDTHPSPSLTPPEKWEDLVPEVKSFAAAATKQQKQEWFSKHLRGLPIDVVALSRVSIKGELTRFERVASFVQWGPQITVRIPIPEDVLRGLDNFFQDWFSRQAIPAAVERIDFRKLGEQFDQRAATDTSAVVTWARKYLTMWLVADHGQIEAAGHGGPSAEGYSTLPEAAVTEGIFRTVGATVSKLEKENLLPVELPGLGQVFVVGVRFEDLPNDTAIIIADKDGRIVRMFWHII